MEFRLFLEQHETYMKDVRKTLAKLPKAHRKLVQGYSYDFQGTNTLKGDCDHIGYVDEEKKKIVVASPWNYGREYTLLHEIAHTVWKYLVDESRRKKWMKIVEKTKHKQNQGAEELFCMAYANFYAKNKIEIHTHKTWETFIKNLPK